MTVREREPGISAAIVLAVVRALRELGCVVEDPPVVGEYVPGAAADAILENAARDRDDPAIGLTVARMLAPGALGPLDYVLFTTEVWGAALALVAKYYGAASERVTTVIETHGDESAVVMHRPPPFEATRMWQELAFGVITMRARQALHADWKPLRVELAHPAPARVDGHVAMFGAPVVFGASGDRLVFASSWLQASSRTAMAALADVLEAQLAKLVAKDVDATMQRIQDAVVRAVDTGAMEIDQVAAQLAMSTRSLQRALAQRGRTFSDVVDDCRRARALEYLRAGQTIAQVARRIGFSDPSALFRAYRRWTGTTPGADRETTG
ncbi:MAG: AraC family transcriptional regulator ligand-binding domain-containing protein [Kofleriaceae bacterium]|nr:AraC family transcriptional regulator ligand-binding domain-containing protein [Kofleriaceae bacterium]